MKIRTLSAGLTLSVAVVLAACQDSGVPFSPDVSDPAAAFVPNSPQQVGAWFRSVTPEVLEIPQTVFADNDETANQLVIGVENPGIATAVEAVMRARGVPASAYRIELTEPIHFAATLRDRHRPTMGGIQIHFGNYLCTLGFNVDHADGPSFITNSHCTNHQGGTEGTQYYQPLSSNDPTVIAVEADDPGYFKNGQCSRGKQCRYSDSSRALYQPGIQSNRGYIGKTTGVNSGSITLNGSFRVTSQDNSSTNFSGTVHKVGRTTGWTSGTVTNSCVTVNVSGTNIQLLCQTIVQNSGTRIVGPGDSGSNMFQRLSGDDVKLIGILWGGNSSGDLLVFSPLKSIQDDLGGVTATFDGSGGGTGGGGGGGGGGSGGGECVPRGNSSKCK